LIEAKIDASFVSMTGRGCERVFIISTACIVMLRHEASIYMAEKKFNSNGLMILSIETKIDASFVSMTG